MIRRGDWREGKGESPRNFLFSLSQFTCHPLSKTTLEYDQINSSYLPPFLTATHSLSPKSGGPFIPSTISSKILLFKTRYLRGTYSRTSSRSYWWTWCITCYSRCDCRIECQIGSTIENYRRIKSTLFSSFSALYPDLVLMSEWVNVGRTIKDSSRFRKPTKDLYSWESPSKRFRPHFLRERSSILDRYPPPRTQINRSRETRRFSGFEEFTRGS